MSSAPTSATTSTTTKSTTCGRRRFGATVDRDASRAHRKRNNKKQATPMCLRYVSCGGILGGSLEG
eukprot:2784997-Pyramimonas_sp.AAC.1